MADSKERRSAWDYLNSGVVVAIVSAIGLAANSLISSGYFSDKTICLIHEGDVKRLNDAADELQLEQTRVTSYLLDVTEAALEYNEKLAANDKSLAQILQRKIDAGDKISSDDLRHFEVKFKPVPKMDNARARDASNTVSKIVTEFFRRCPR